MANESYIPNPLCKWVSIINAANPKFPQWKVKSLEYRDSTTQPPSDEAANIYVITQDQKGNPLGGIWVWQSWQDGTADKTTDRNGRTDFFMSGDSSFDPNKGQVGAYSIYIRFKDYPTATAKGFGLPLKRHVQYIITFELIASEVIPTPITLEDATLQAAHTKDWMPINNMGALWKYAKANNLEDAQTDEIKFTWNGAEYLCQVFNRGIVYAKVGDWANIKMISK